MTNLKNTVDSALPVGAQAAYPREYAAVMDALNERDYRLTDLIATEVSRRLGVTEEQVKDQLVAAGMEVRPAPEPEPVPDMAAFEADVAPAKKAKKSKGKKSEVAKLAKVVDQLVKAARRHGVSI